MKSFLHMYTALYAGLVKDLTATYPPLAHEFERDFNRLLQSIETEGLGFIALTHGEIEASFLRALSMKEGLAHQSRPRGYGRKSKEDVRPKYLWGLHSLVFHSDGTLLDEVDPTAVFFIRQWLSMAKKALLPCTEERNAQALCEWKEIENLLPDHRPGTWDNLVPCFAPYTGHPLWGPSDGSSEQKCLPGLAHVDSVEPEFWSYARLLARLVISSFGEMDIFTLRPKHGPGAVAEGSRIVKYDFPYWPLKLDSLFSWDWFATHDYGYTRHVDENYPKHVELASLMYLVPKTQKGPRLIAAEPTAHQWIQGGIQRWLEERVHNGVLKNFINFRDQSLSQDMVLKASIDGSLATIDLSSASDRLSTRLVDWCFQSHIPLLEALHACRTQYCKLPDGSYHRLRKFSTQGSANTFPVQSIVFVILALSSITWKRGSRIPNLTDLEGLAGQVRVFGDDIIIPTSEYEHVCAVLASAGLKVNANKSFSTGLFRESCGMDAFAGVNVTPIRPKRPYKVSQPESLVAIIASANDLHNAGLWNCAEAILKTVPMKIRRRILIGWQETGALVLTSFTGPLDDGSYEYHPELQYLGYNGIGLSSKVTYTKSTGAAGLLQFFTEEPEPDSKYESGRAGRPKLRLVRRFASIPLIPRPE
nr:MAG: RNA-dependent RNA polymerase [Hangzhou steitz-like virus 3]